MQIGKAARSNGSHIKSRLKMEPHGVFKEVTKQCTNKDHYQSVSHARHNRYTRGVPGASSQRFLRATSPSILTHTASKKIRNHNIN